MFPTPRVKYLFYGFRAPRASRGYRAFLGLMEMGGCELIGLMVLRWLEFRGFRAECLI